MKKTAKTQKDQENQIKNKKGFDYKWVVIGACFCMVMITLGFCSSTKSLFTDRVSEYLGLTDKMFLYTFNDSFRHISTAIVNFFFGFLIMKFGPRKLIAGGFISLILSSICYALAENIWVLYLGGVFLGVGLSWTTTTMVGFVVNRWSKENKGTIMGAILAANGLGGAIATLVLDPIISFSLDVQGFQSETNPISRALIDVLAPVIEFVAGIPGYKLAYLFVAVVLFVVGLIITILFRDNPKEQQKDTQVEIPKKKARGSTWVGLEFSQTRKKWYFYTALFCILGVGFFLTACNSFAVPHMREQMPEEQHEYIRTIWALHSLALAGFKFLTGFIYDKLGLRTTILICSTTAFVVVLCLALINQNMSSTEQVVLAAIYSIFSGLALPLETVMIPIIAGDLFGQKSFDEVLGISVSMNAIGYAIASPAMGLLHDFFHNYSYGMFICLGLLLLVIVVMQLTITSAHRQRRKVEETQKIEQTNE